MAFFSPRLALLALPVAHLVLGSPEERPQFARLHGNPDAPIPWPISHVINLAICWIGSKRQREAQNVRGK
jgi:hypothetical protein